jgi:hypothetical protein
MNAVLTILGMFTVAAGLLLAAMGLDGDWWLIPLGIAVAFGGSALGHWALDRANQPRPYW